MLLEEWRYTESILSLHLCLLGYLRIHRGDSLELATVPIVTGNNVSSCRGGKNFMDQIEISKQSSDKSGEVSASIVKPPKSIAKDRNMNTIIENFEYFIHLFLEDRKKVLLPYQLFNYRYLAPLTKVAISSKTLRLRYPGPGIEYIRVSRREGSISPWHS